MNQNKQHSERKDIWGLFFFLGAKFAILFQTTKQLLQKT
jgi:hypothetical protein